MIELKLTADTPEQLHREMLALLAGTAVSSYNPQPQEPTATGAKRSTRGGKKADDDAGAQDAVTENSDAGATGSEGQSSAAGEPTTGPLTKETLSPRILSLGQKLGSPAVQELFGEFGASKFSEITEDKYPALSARLDQLLA